MVVDGDRDEENHVFLQNDLIEDDEFESMFTDTTAFETCIST